MIFATGDTGFVQSKFVLKSRNATGEFAINVDKLHHAGALNNLAPIKSDKCLQFVHDDIGGNVQVLSSSAALQPYALGHIVAETHLDPPVLNSDEYVVTNFDGVIRLLEADHKYWSSLSDSEKAASCFLLVFREEEQGASSSREALINEAVA